MVKRLLLLNGLAIFGAVIYHASGWGYTAMFWWTDQYRPVSVPNFDQLGGFSYFGFRFFEQLVIFSIPAFLFISGFFIAFATQRDRPTVKWEIPISRIGVLVVPYLLWSILILIGNMIQGISYTPIQAIFEIATGQISPPYYYIPLLIQLFLLSPLIVYIAKKNWRVLLVIVAILHLAFKIPSWLGLLDIKVFGTLIKPWFLQSWFFPNQILWFVCGVIAGLNIKAFKQFLARIKWFALAGAIILLPICMYEWEFILRNSSEGWVASSETLIDNLYSIFFIIAFLAFDEVKIPFSKYLDGLASKSFGIYLVHSPILEFTARVVYHLVPVILGIQIIFQPLLVVAGIGGALLLMWLFEKSPVRQYYQYVFG